jgi:thiamine pyrophosphokinase
VLRNWSFCAAPAPFPNNLLEPGAASATCWGSTGSGFALLTLHVVKLLGKEIPDLITGDFDSADFSNVEYFRSQGARLQPTFLFLFYQ